MLVARVTTIACRRGRDGISLNDVVWTLLVVDAMAVAVAVAAGTVVHDKT